MSDYFVCYECKSGNCDRCVGIPCMCPCEVPVAHTGFEIKTERGNLAIIKGNPNMPEATRKALAEMIDAAVEASIAGELGKKTSVKKI